jgi:hypothetical protein
LLQKNATHGERITDVTESVHHLLLEEIASSASESPPASHISGWSSARTPSTQPRASARSTSRHLDFASPSKSPNSLSALFITAQGVSDDDDRSPVSLHGAFGPMSFCSVVGGKSRSKNHSATRRAQFEAMLSDPTGVPFPDVDVCFQSMKDRVEQQHHISTPMSRSVFDCKSAAQKLQYLTEISGASDSSTSAPRVYPPTSSDALGDHSWQDLEAFCDTLYDCARTSAHDSKAWQSKSVTQKIRYLAELKTPMIGNTPLPPKKGFVRAHKYPVFLASEAAATMTDEQRMIMLNFQNSKINQMYKPSQEKHNKWEKELRNCFEKGKAMSPAAIQHVTCQVQSLVEYYQTELAKPGTDRAQMDDWLKQTLKPLMFNPTGADEKFKPGKDFQAQIEAALNRFSDGRLKEDVKALFAKAKREVLESDDLWDQNAHIRDFAGNYDRSTSKAGPFKSKMTPEPSSMRGQGIAGDGRHYRITDDGNFDQRYKIKDISQLQQRSQSSASIVGYDCVAGQVDADYSFPFSAHSLARGEHTAADGRHYRITDDGNFDQRYKIKDISQLQQRSQSSASIVGYDCVAGQVDADYSFPFSAHSLARGEHTAADGRHYRITDDGNFDQRYKIKDISQLQQRSQSSASIVGGDFQVMPNFAAAQTHSRHSGPRCPDGSLDMRHACNRGKSKFDD